MKKIYLGLILIPVAGFSSIMGMEEALRKSGKANKIFGSEATASTQSAAQSSKKKLEFATSGATQTQMMQSKVNGMIANANFNAMLQARARNLIASNAYTTEEGRQSMIRTGKMVAFLNKADKALVQNGEDALSSLMVSDLAEFISNCNQECPDSK